MIAIFDAQMIAVFELTDSEFDKLINNINKVRDATIHLFSDSVFVDAVRASTNTPKKLIYRIEAVKNMLNDLV